MTVNSATKPVPSGCVVELRLARIPGFLGKMAAHYWLVVKHPELPVERWEIWQSPNLAAESWGHLHKNLKPACDGVGNGPSWTEQTWNGPDAERIADVLHRASREYPACQIYRIWPGPNSNTFVQWVLRTAGQPSRLGPLGIGASFVRHL